jgi:hypothetical protein
MEKIKIFPPEQSHKNEITISLQGEFMEGRGRNNSP